MSKLQIIFIAGIAFIAMEFLAGFMVMTYGVKYKTVDMEAAAGMLAFISENNPGYYERIESGVDPAYRESFYAHYTKTGDRKSTIAGLLLMLIAVGNVVPLAAIFLLQNEMTEKRNRVDLKGDDETDNKAGDKAAEKASVEADDKTNDGEKEKSAPEEAKEVKKQEDTTEEENAEEPVKAS